MNTETKMIYVIRHEGERIDLRDTALDLTGLPWLYTGANCVVAGAHRDGSLLAVAMVHEDVDLEDALDACLGALEHQGAEAAVAYSPLHGAGVPVGMLERHALFGIGRCLAADWGIHLVDWLLCGDGTYRRLKPVAADPSDWWDVPVPARDPRDASRSG